MSASHRRHDLSDRVWDRLKAHLPGAEGKVGRPAYDNWLFLNAVFWILRTGAPWRDLPPDYGDWKNTHRRFCRWRDRGVWAKLLDDVIDDPDFEWLMIDASHIKVHPHAAAHWEEIRKWPTQKGAEYQAASGGGFPRYAGTSDSDQWDYGRLLSSNSID